MKEFITQFPEVVLSLMVMLLAIIGWGIRQSILKLNTTMTSIVTSNINMDLRLTAQEAICALCRSRCPSAHVRPLDGMPEKNNIEAMFKGA